MNAENSWKMFLETGAPEFYLMYSQAKRTEENYVFNSAGVGTAGYKL